MHSSAAGFGGGGCWEGGDCGGEQEELAVCSEEVSLGDHDASRPQSWFFRSENQVRRSGVWKWSVEIFLLPWSTMLSVTTWGINKVVA